MDFRSDLARKLFVSVVTLLLILGGAAGIFLLMRPAQRFQRMSIAGWKWDDHFRLDSDEFRLYFTRQGMETAFSDIPSLEIFPFYLRGKRRVSLDPSIHGDTGFYSYLFCRSLTPGKTIRFFLKHFRKGREQILERIETEHLSHPLMKEVLLHKGDRLFFEFEGFGVVYFSRPIMYQISKPERRNMVILVGVDTLRADAIGKKVNGRALTPNIDQFSTDGTVFSRAYSQSSWTIPAFISFFTGLYEFNHRVSIDRLLPPEIPHLVSGFNSKFLSFGIHGGMGLSPNWGYGRGFDYYMELPQTGPLYPRGGESLFEKALEFLRLGRFPDLLLFLHTYQVHSPYTPPEEFLLSLNPRPKYKALEVVNAVKPELTYMPVEEETARALPELYLAEVHAFDSFFGRFITELKKSRLYEGAMIVLFSDHGEEFFEHGGWAHSHSLYDELIHIPLIIKFPGGKHGGVHSNGLAGIIDILPTLYDFYRLPQVRTREVDGRSLLPLLKGTPAREHLVSSISCSRYIEAIPPRFA